MQSGTQPQASTRAHCTRCGSLRSSVHLWTIWVPQIIPDCRAKIFLREDYVHITTTITTIWESCTTRFRTSTHTHTHTHLRLHEVDKRGVKHDEGLFASNSQRVRVRCGVLPIFFFLSPWQETKKKRDKETKRQCDKRDRKGTSTKVCTNRFRPQKSRKNSNSAIVRFYIMTVVDLLTVASWVTC